MAVTRGELIEAISHKEGLPVDEATAIVVAALSAGYSISEILDVLLYHDIDTLILNSWSRKTFNISGGPL